ncbi:hypothetical protein MCUN1_000777 [Malassezia cuniculi]|uniref:SEC7 domain-containing protein n=1 Tax=Malassezia cuniculi TaxID=948313 RepID=A0AAF0ESE1_9BASI|nr:hypothetical protein MCUN1_000777 [Malassezia cuniculi]
MEPTTRSVPGRAGVDEWQAATLYVVEHEGMMQLELQNGDSHVLWNDADDVDDHAAAAVSPQLAAESKDSPLEAIHAVAVGQPVFSSPVASRGPSSPVLLHAEPEERIRLRNGTAGRAIVLTEAPRAESLYVTLERTMSLSRSIAMQGDADEEWTLPIERREGETPLALSRRLYAASKSDPFLAGRTASILASGASSLLRDALDCYIERFHFDESPVDMALRGLLALEHLPAESQQIDRIISAFARRYSACNPGVLTTDQTYMLSFALLMLHTATFNRNVKGRMTRAEFVAIAGSSGLEKDLLEYYYDNTTLIEFSYARSNGESSESHGAFSVAPESGSEKAALYKLIATGRVHELRLRIAALESLDSPFVCAPSKKSAECVRQSFVNGHPLELRVSQKPPRRALWRTRAAADEHTLLVRVSRLGIVRRRESQPARSLVSNTAPRWKAYGLVVTGSALLWFRDTSVVEALRDRLDVGSGSLSLRADDVTPLDDALCVQETSDVHALRIRAQQRWHIVQAMDGSDADWMETINYVASLCNCGLAWDDAACLAGLGSATARVLPHRAHPAPLARVDNPRLSESSAPLTRPRARHRYSASLPDVRTVRQKVSAPSLAALNGDTRMLLTAALHGVNYHIANNTQREAQLNVRLGRELSLMRHLCLITPLQKSTRDHFEALARQVHRGLRATQYEYAYVECRLSALRVEHAELQEQLQLYT